MRAKSLFIASVALVLASGFHPSAQSSAFVIGADDVLTVTVWNQPELSGKFTVQADGDVAFPLVGRVPAAGFTPRQVEESIARLLSTRYVKDPQVSLAVERKHTETAYVTGEVRQPGAYPLSGPLTLVELLARAGSTTDKAGSIAIVTRPRAMSPPAAADAATVAPSILRVDLKTLQSGAMPPVALVDGDVVFVPRAETIYVLGGVRNPGSYTLPDHVTVLQAMALAGGLSERGSDKRIRISRMVDGIARETRATLSDVLRPGDTIIVGERLF